MHRPLFAIAAGRTMPLRALMLLALTTVVATITNAREAPEYRSYETLFMMGEVSYEFSIDFPESWGIEESQSGNDIVRFGTPVGENGVVCVVQVLDLGGRPDPASVRNIMTAPQLRAHIPEGADAIRAFPSTMAERRSGTVDYTQILDMDEGPVRVILRQTSLFIEDHIFSLGCGIRGKQTVPYEVHDTLFNNYSSQFDHMQRSIRLQRQ